MAQLAEQLICNQQVIGSSPIIGFYGWIPERPKGADCKSVVDDFGGSNPPSPTKKTQPQGCGFFAWGKVIENLSCASGGEFESLQR